MEAAKLNVSHTFYYYCIVKWLLNENYQISLNISGKCRCQCYVALFYSITPLKSILSLEIYLSHPADPNDFSFFLRMTWDKSG